jgi:hypothetical protein
VLHFSGPFLRIRPWGGGSIYRKGPYYSVVSYVIVGGSGVLELQKILDFSTPIGLHFMCFLKQIFVYTALQYHLFI